MEAVVCVPEQTLWIIIVIYASFLYVLDKNRCKTMDGVLYIHNLISAFGNLGWLSCDMVTLMVYIFTLLMMVILWMVNHNLCFLTEWHNRLCGRPRSSLYFDIFYIVGLKKYKFWNDWGHYVFAVSTFAYAVYKLYSLMAGYPTQG
jgi:hypothetical protein